MDYPTGVDPYVTRQHLLHHRYSPLISTQASYNADKLVQRVLGVDDISMLQILRPYGNNAKYTIPNQSFKIVNIQLINKNYPSFPVRFEPSLPELLTVFNAPRTNEGANTGVEASSKPDQLFSISSLELLLKHQASESNKDLYLSYFNKIITSNNIVPFETFNHPISQIFIIDYETDSLEALRKLIVDFRNHSFPKFFNIDDLLIHVFVLYDSNKFSSSEILTFQGVVKTNLNVVASAIPVGVPAENESVESIRLSVTENSTIEEDLQRISLQQSSSSFSNYIQVPKSIDSVLRSKLYEFINRFLIPHMQSKIRIWDDQFLQPKKSITGRLFSASKKFFNNDGTALTSSGTGSAYNYNESYYYKSTPEQTIRKLADWSLILKDFKYAYSTYDVIKKDYTNDKAWVYVASTQEMCIVSLLLAQTQQTTANPIPPDKNTLRKIRHDIIEPYIDNLSYTFKSRLNLKTYSLKTLAMVIELLLCMCITFDISWHWNDLIERFLLNSINEYDTHLTSANKNSQVIRAILYERLGYSSGQCLFLPSSEVTVVPELHTAVKKREPVEEGHYTNPHKLMPPINLGIAGLTRYRKSSIWYLLSMKEWLILENYRQIDSLMHNIRLVYKVGDIGPEWYDRNDMLLGFIKRCLLERPEEKEEK